MENKRQWIEYGKTFGIAVLSISAVLLAIKAYFLPDLVNQFPLRWATGWIFQISDKTHTLFLVTSLHEGCDVNIPFIRDDALCIVVQLFFCRLDVHLNMIQFALA